MLRWRDGRVVALTGGWAGVVLLDADVDGEVLPALAYPALVGSPEVGDRVLLTTGPLARGLGTGGRAMVAAVPDRLPADVDGPGHLVKARYTPLQPMVLGADDPEAPSHDVLRDADDLAGVPVVVADLHSALPAVVAGVHDARPDARVVHVWLDSAALPAWFSRTCAQLREAGVLASVVTTGQAFGGDLEAATVHSGLLAAVHVARADVVVVAPGPGVLGTGTRWGFGGVQCGEAVNAVGVLGGRAVAALRVSGSDPRERHRGVSHHSLTAYGRVATAPADVVVVEPADDLGRRVLEQARSLEPPHQVHVEPAAGLIDALRASAVQMSSMGRGLDDDPATFLTPAAAGRWATRVLPLASTRARAAGGVG